MVAESLRGMLEPEFELLDIVDDGRTLVEAALRLQPDMILADISMPNLNGLDAIYQLRREGCDTKIIILTMHKDVLYAARALHAGASGFVLKHSVISELLTALRTVLSGGIYLTPEISRMMEHLPSISTRGEDELVILTPRQREILQLYAEGNSAKKVSSILHISTRTAENHKAQLMNALGIRSTAELVCCAIRHGLIAPC